MIKTRYIRRYFIEKAVQEFKPKGKILEVASGKRWQYFKNSITLNRDKSSEADVIGDAEKMPFENETFDSVLCLEIIEHTPNPQKLINEIYRVLKPNGQVLLSLPFNFEIHDVEDYYRFTKQGLILLFKDFKDIEIKENGGMACVIFHFLGLTKIGRFFYPIFNNFGYYLDKIVKGNKKIILDYILYTIKGE